MQGRGAVVLVGLISRKSQCSNPAPALKYLVIEPRSPFCVIKGGDWRHHNARAHTIIASSPAIWEPGKIVGLAGTIHKDRQGTERPLSRGLMRISSPTTIIRSQICRIQTLEIG
jgi:hypothetical protein